MPIAGSAQPFNRQQPKGQKAKKEWHSPQTKYGMGDHYGQAIKQKVGRIRDSSVEFIPMSSKKMGKPPKSLA
jgi:hypothetical protein